MKAPRRCLLLREDLHSRAHFQSKRKNPGQKQNERSCELWRASWKNGSSGLTWFGEHHQWWQNPSFLLSQNKQICLQEEHSGKYAEALVCLSLQKQTLVFSIGLSLPTKRRASKSRARSYIQARGGHFKIYPLDVIVIRHNRLLHVFDYRNSILCRRYTSVFVRTLYILPEGISFQKIQNTHLRTGF